MTPARAALLDVPAADHFRRERGSYHFVRRRPFR